MKEFKKKEYTINCIKTATSILLLILWFTFGSCLAKEKNATYYKGRTFTYIVEISSDSAIEKHLLKLKVTNSFWVSLRTGGQTGIKYIYTDVTDSTTGSPLIETTGVIDKNNRVFLHPPRMAYMAFAEIPPMPDINRQTEVGVYSETVLYGIQGHGSLDGKKIKQADTVVAKKNVTLLGKKYDQVWIIHGENMNYLKELGKYKVVYWFDQQYGFIRMKYLKPNGEVVDLKLKEVKG